MRIIPIRLALVLAMLVPMGVLGLGAVQAQFRNPQPGGPVPPGGPRNPGVPQPIVPINPNPQPVVPINPNPQPVVPINPNPGNVVPRSQPPVIVWYDVYTCRRCGKQYQVPAGSPPPAQCTCGNSGSASYNHTPGSSSSPNSSAPGSSGVSGTTVAIVAAFMAGFLVLIVLCVGFGFLIRYLVISLTSGDSLLPSATEIAATPVPSNRQCVRIRAFGKNDWFSGAAHEVSGRPAAYFVRGSLRCSFFPNTLKDSERMRTSARRARGLLVWRRRPR